MNTTEIQEQIEIITKLITSGIKSEGRVNLEGLLEFYKSILNSKS